MTMMKTCDVSLRQPLRRTWVCALALFVLWIGLSTDAASAQSGDQEAERDTPSLDPFWYGAYVKVQDEGVRIEQILVEMPSVPVREGDVVTQINDRPVRTIKDLTAAFEDGKAGEQVDFVVLRNREEVHLRFDRPNPSTLPKLRLEAME
jgi:S1-C subfamily serine protease